jgi:hypothetical protein
MATKLVNPTAGGEQSQDTAMIRLNVSQELNRLRVQVGSITRAANSVMPKFNKISIGGQDTVSGWLSRDLYDANRLLRRTIDDIDLLLDALDFCRDVEREP